jgi:hypothetical protein
VVKYNVFLKDMDEMASESPHGVHQLQCGIFVLTALLSNERGFRCG